MFSPVGPDEVARELQRLLDLPEFQRNRNASAFLKFVVEETLAGRGDRLKAFTIATLALQRDDTFDPQNNSIVRVQATRVRQMLDAHYVSVGQDHSVRISLPRGSYVPSFEPGPGGPSQADMPKHGRPATGRRRVALPLVAAGIVLGLGLGAISQHYLWALWSRPSASVAESSQHQTLPLVLVSVDRTLRQGPDDSGVADGLAASIRSSLSAFDTLIVSHDDAAQQRPDYVMTISELGRSQDTASFAINLAHRATGAIVWTANFPDLSLRDSRASVDQATRRVVSAVGGMSGLIFGDWAARTAGAGEKASPATCLLAAARVLRGQSQADRGTARSCLERDLAAHPDNATAMSVLAMVLLADYANGQADASGVATLQRALRLARQAYDLAPHRAASQFALFQARFYDKRFEDAFAIGHQALASNPNAGEIRATLGAAYVLRGQYDTGLALLREAYDGNPSLPGTFAAVMAIGERMKGNRPQFVRWASRVSVMTTPLGISVQMLELDDRHDSDGVDRAWEALVQTFPEFAADPAGTLDRLGVADPVRSLLADLVVRVRTAHAAAGMIRDVGAPDGDKTER
jgi:adenylate cyclase